MLRTYAIVMMFVLSIGLSLSVQAGEKIKYMSNDKALIFKGEWKGIANTTKGSFKGRSTDFEFNFAKGDFSQLSGIAYNKIIGGKLIKFSPTNRAVLMAINYAFGPKEFTVTITAKFNEAFTEFTGQYEISGGFGSGDVTMKKSLEHTLPVEKVNGKWTGNLSFQQRGQDVQQEVTTTLVGMPQEKDGYKIGEQVIKAIKQGVYDAENRRLHFEVIVQGKRKDTLKIQGVLSSDFKTFEGIYKSRTMGSGKITLQNHTVFKPSKKKKKKKKK